MAGKKRTRNGQVKPSNATSQSTTEHPTTTQTPRCAQHPVPSSTSADSQTTPHTNHPTAPSKPAAQVSTSAPSKPSSGPTPARQKLPKLPPNTKISKRQLIHPSLPTPFSSSSSPKIIYITPSTPFIPALKRIRTLLAEISRREKTSLQAGKKARPLSNAAVERDIADAGGHGGVREKVFLKATGRAIPRALEVGVEMQSEGCVVRVEMGSVRAVDDVEIVAGTEGEDEDIPETRIRNVSSVTVSIWAK